MMKVVNRHSRGTMRAAMAILTANFIDNCVLNYIIVYFFYYMFAGNNQSRCCMSCQSEAMINSTAVIDNLHSSS